MTKDCDDLSCPVCYPKVEDYQNDWVSPEGVVVIYVGALIVVGLVVLYLSLTMTQGGG